MYIYMYMYICIYCILFTLNGTIGYDGYTMDMLQFSETEFPILILLILLLKKTRASAENIGIKVSALSPS